MSHFYRYKKKAVINRILSCILILFILTGCASSETSSLPENDPNNIFSNDAEETWRYSLMSSSDGDTSTEISSVTANSTPLSSKYNTSSAPSSTSLSNSENVYIQYYDEFKGVKTGDSIGPFTVSEATATYKTNTEESIPDSALFNKNGYIFSSANIKYIGKSVELTGYIMILKNQENYNVIRFVPDSASIVKIPIIAEATEDFYILIPANKQGNFRYDWDGKKEVYLTLSDIHLVSGVGNAKNEATLSSYRFL